MKYTKPTFPVGSRLPAKYRKINTDGCICNHIDDFIGRTCPLCKGEKQQCREPKDVKVQPDAQWRSDHW